MITNVEILRKNGDKIISIDFGETYYNPDRCITKSIQLYNNTDTAITVNVDVIEPNEYS